MYILIQRESRFSCIETVLVANITNAVPSLKSSNLDSQQYQAYSGGGEQICQHCQCCTFPSMYILFHTESSILREEVLPTLPMVHCHFNEYFQSSNTFLIDLHSLDHDFLVGGSSTHLSVILINFFRLHCPNFILHHILLNMP